MKENAVREKSKAFALRIVKMYQYICAEKEFVLSKQALRSGTSVGVRTSVKAIARKAGRSLSPK